MAVNEYVMLVFIQEVMLSLLEDMLSLLEVVVKVFQEEHDELLCDAKKTTNTAIKETDKLRENDVTCST